MLAAAIVAVYVLSGTARVQVAPFPSGDHAGDMRVTLSEARLPGHVSVRIESSGHSCVLAASRSRNGALEFSTPASCPIDVARSDARGHLDARLQSGRGNLQGDRLSLELRFDVTGRIATRIDRTRVRILGAEVVIPEGWTPEAPIRGTVTTSGSGLRQEG